MSHDVQTEGSPDLVTWLKQFEINDKFAKQYVTSLEELGIESVNDFKYIAEQKDFDELMNNVKGVRFMDRKKVQTAWRSLHPQGSASSISSNSVPMDTKEREALETLGKYAQMVQSKLTKYEHYLDDSKFLMQQSNRIREQVESLKNAIDQRGNELMKQLQNQYNDIKNECGLEYKKWKDIGIKIHSTKQQCDNALKISDFQQLETRRNTIINSVNETVKAIKVAVDDVAVVDHKEIVVDLEELKQMEQKMKNSGRVYTQCFEINVTNVSLEGPKLIINWCLKNEKEAELFASVCNKLKVKVGIVGCDDADEKEMEQPGNDKASDGIKWIAQITDDATNNKIEKTNTEIGNMVKRKTVLVVQVVALGDNDKVTSQTQYQYFDYKEDGLKFVGYVDWVQKGVMSKDEEDNAMNNACSSKYDESRAATYKEFVDGTIKGLVQPKTSPSRVLLHSGNDDFWKGSAHQSGKRQFYRKGLEASNYPWNNNEWTNCSGTTRQTIAVCRILSFDRRGPSKS